MADDIEHLRVSTVKNESEETEKKLMQRRKEKNVKGDW